MRRLASIGGVAIVFGIQAAQNCPALQCLAGTSVDRSRIRTILALALPIIGGMVSQNVLNLVDTAMVGYLGDEALAAVGIASFGNFMAMAFITGMGAGVQSMAARRKGEGNTDSMAVPLNGGLVLAAGLALPWSGLLVMFTPDLFWLLNSDPEVISLGVPYLQARLFGMTAIGLNYAFRGYWNGVNLSRLYLSTLVVMHIANIGLNWVLIFGNLGAPAMGATGAGIASAVSTYVGTATYVFLGLRHASKAGFLRELPGKKQFRTLLRLAIPAGAQQLFLAAGFTVFFRIVGAVGTQELAAANVVLNVMLVGLLPGIGLGLAANSLVSQSLGRGDKADAKRWGWDVVRVALVVMVVLALPMVLAPDLVLSAFLHDPDTLAIARPALRLTGLTLALDAVGMVLLNALQGAGATRMAAGVAVACQWGVGLPMAFVLGPMLGLDLVWIWASQGIYRAGQAMIYAVVWKRGKWAEIAV